MATIAISELPSVATLTGASILPVVQSGVTQQTTIAAIMTQATVFSPSGTGATNRTPQSKIHELGISVVDYGATGDGITDDRTAFANAITAANGRKILVPRPSSSYKIGSALTLSSTDRLYVEEGVTFTTNTPLGGSWEYELAQPTATAGSLMKIEHLFESFSTTGNGLVHEGGLWTGKTHTFFGISREFTSVDGGASSPSTPLFVWAVNNGSPGDIVGSVIDVIAKQSNGTAWGINTLSRGEAGALTPKLVGIEIDIAPAAGYPASPDSGGLFINVFNDKLNGAAINIGGNSGGTFSNIIAITGNATDATASGFFSNDCTMDSLINTGTSTYNSAAIKLTNTHRIQLSGTASAHGFVYNDSSNNVRCVLGSGSWIFRNNADSTSLAFFDSGGNLNLSSTASIFWDAAQSTTTAGAGGQTLPANPQGFVTINVGGTSRKIPYYPVS